MARLPPGAAADRPRSIAEAYRRRGPLAISRADVADIGVGGAARAAAHALVPDAEFPVALAAVALEDDVGAGGDDDDAVGRATRDDVESDLVARPAQAEAGRVVSRLILVHGEVDGGAKDFDAAVVVAQRGVVRDQDIAGGRESGRAGHHAPQEIVLSVV